MNTAIFTRLIRGKWLAMALVPLVLAGCVTTPKIDWPARIGNYTYDQAVIELGPPDKSATLSDGTVVAEWLMEHAQTLRAPEPYFLPPGSYFGPLTPMYSQTYIPARYLRLTFGADSKLKSWKRIGG